MEIDRETFDFMVQDWLAEHSSEMYDLELTGEPRIDEDGRWTQEAETETHTYTLIATDGGDIRLSYSGTK